MSRPSGTNLNTARIRSRAFRGTLHSIGRSSIKQGVGRDSCERCADGRNATSPEARGSAEYAGRSNRRTAHDKNKYHVGNRKHFPRSQRSSKSGSSSGPRCIYRFRSGAECGCTPARMAIGGGFVGTGCRILAIAGGFVGTKCRIMAIGGGFVGTGIRNMDGSGSES
jgi:hypothetical protein